MKTTLFIGPYGAEKLNYTEKRVFSDQQEAMTYWWAMPRLHAPKTAWFHSGADGWYCSNSTVGQSVPDTLAVRVNVLLEHDKLVHQICGG